MKFLRSPKLFGVAVAALAAALGAADTAYAARAYIGTYTPDPADPRSSSNGRQGIYLVNIDDATGAPSGLKLVAKDLSPSWIAFSKDHKFLYAVNEVGSYGANKSGSITAYAVDAASGALKKLNTVDSGGAIPCYVSVDPSGWAHFEYVKLPEYRWGIFLADPVHDRRIDCAANVLDRNIVEYLNTPGAVVDRHMCGMRAVAIGPLRVGESCFNYNRASG